MKAEKTMITERACLGQGLSSYTCNSHRPGRSTFVKRGWQAATRAARCISARWCRSLIIMCCLSTVALLSACGSGNSGSGNVASQVDAVENIGDSIYVVNGHRFVDLGLPSGLRWAETNVGADSASADGSYFAFGETEPKTDFSWETYKWGASADSLTKYDSSDKKATLEAADDVAAVKWGGGCRMPSKAEFDELNNSCVWTWVGNGFKVTSKANGRSVFFPASGYYADKVLCRHGSGGMCWTSTAVDGGKAGIFYFDCGGSGVGSNDVARNTGLTVRPVLPR